MSTTSSLDHRSSRQDFTEEHGVDPGLGSWLLGLVGLALIIAGDFASFNIALSRSFSAMGPTVLLALTLAMTAAAVLLMFEAGRAEAKRRSRNHGGTGRAPVVTRIFAWLLLGVTAFTLRMAAPPEVTAGNEDAFQITGPPGPTPGFGTTAPGFGSTATDGFGSAAAAGGTQPIQFGPLTLHPENVTSAVALLAIFVAGGVGAFFLAKEGYNPLLTDVRRARRARWIAHRRFMRAQARHDRALARAAATTARCDQYEQAVRDLEVVSDLEHQLDLYEADLAHAREASAALAAIDRTATSAEAELASLGAEARGAQRQAEHAGASAKELARVLIAEYRGEPAATSGLTNGVQR